MEFVNRKDDIHLITKYYHLAIPALTYVPVIIGSDYTDALFWLESYNNEACDDILSIERLFDPSIQERAWIRQRVQLRTVYIDVTNHFETRHKSLESLLANIKQHWTTVIKTASITVQTNVIVKTNRDGATALRWGYDNPVQWRESPVINGPVLTVIAQGGNKMLRCNHGLIVKWSDGAFVRGILHALQNVSFKHVVVFHLNDDTEYWKAVIPFLVFSTFRENVVVVRQATDLQRAVSFQDNFWYSASFQELQSFNLRIESHKPQSMKIILENVSRIVPHCTHLLITSTLDATSTAVLQTTFTHLFWKITGTPVVPSPTSFMLWKEVHDKREAFLSFEAADIDMMSVLRLAGMMGPCTNTTISVNVLFNVVSTPAVVSLHCEQLTVQYKKASTPEPYDVEKIMKTMISGPRVIIFKERV